MRILRRCSETFLGLIMVSSQLGAAESLQLPDPLKKLDGSRVSTAEAWRLSQRSVILELFRNNVYGRAPVDRPADLSFEVSEIKKDAMDGKATRKQVTISFSGAGGKGAIHLLLFVPNEVRKPVPAFVLINHRGADSIDPERQTKKPFWPAEEIIARGYAAAAFQAAELAPDNKTAFRNGVIRLFTDPKAAPADDAWHAIAAWSWGASRVLDYLVTDTDIDGKKVAVIGHSRGGKAALWAGAQDERFGMVISNESGSTGASLARGTQGENITAINKYFPHWFCANYKRFGSDVGSLPVDQHCLIALIAPRLVYVGSAEKTRRPGH